MKYDATDYNHVLLTLDSVRWDSYEAANTSNLDALCEAKKCHSPGTYTWPSHWSFFSGRLPSMWDNIPLYNSVTQNLWKLKGQSNYIFELPVETTLMNGFRQLGMNTIGTGAVSWFTHPYFVREFEHYEWIPDALSQIMWALSKVDNRRFFMFINFCETHMPYEHRKGPVGVSGKKMRLHAEGKERMSDKELKEAHDCQIREVEYLDMCISLLLDQLPKKTYIVVCSDHGDCFGEDGLIGHGIYHPKVIEVPMLIARLI